MAHAASLIEARSVFLPKSADWLDAFRAEVLQFPHGAYMDQIDALSQYLNWVKRWQDDDTSLAPSGFIYFADGDYWLPYDPSKRLGGSSL